jgi:hypothetical protein
MLVLVTTGSVFAISHDTSPPALPGPADPGDVGRITVASPGRRLVGADGVVVAAPSAWVTELEQGSFCGPHTARVVHFILPNNGPIGSCAGPANAPPAETLTVTTGIPKVVEAAQIGKPSGTVAGMAYYLSTPERVGRAFVQTLDVPDIGLRFESAAATGSTAQALLATIRPAPEGTTTIGVTPQGRDQALALDPDEDLRSKVVEVQEPGGGLGGYPGELLRTEPPVGTPVPTGSTVTMVLAAGNLNAYVTKQSLTAQGWIVTPANQYDPPISRAEALQAVPDQNPNGGSGAVYGIFLRQLGGRLVWIVALPRTPDPVMRLTAVDAHTGKVVNDHAFPMLPDGTK